MKWKKTKEKNKESKGTEKWRKKIDKKRKWNEIRNKRKLKVKEMKMKRKDNDRNKENNE